MIRFRVRNPKGKIRAVRRYFDEALRDMARLGVGSRVESRDGLLLAVRRSASGSLPYDVWSNSAGHMHAPGPNFWVQAKGWS